MFYVFGTHTSSNTKCTFTSQNTVTVVMFSNLLAVLHISKANKTHPMSGNGIGGVIHLLKSDYTE